MKIICDKCKKEFDINKEDIKNKTLDELLINVNYFECNHCNYKYITECVDGYILKEKRRYQKIKDNDKKLKCLNNMKLHSDRLKLKVINLL